LEADTPWQSCTSPIVATALWERFQRGP